MDNTCTVKVFVSDHQDNDVYTFNDVVRVKKPCSPDYILELHRKSGEYIQFNMRYIVRYDIIDNEDLKG